MLEELNFNTKLSNTKINNCSPQIEDNKLSFLTYTLNNNSIGLNDNNFENSSLFDNFSFKNEISSLDKPLSNCQHFDKTIKNNSNNEKINHDKDFSKIGDNQFHKIKQNIKSFKNNDCFIEPKQLQQNSLNRKRKSEHSKGRHTKYSGDNLRRKIKRYTLNYALEFINKKIKQIYQGKIGVGIFKKKLLPINNCIKTNMKIEYNMNLLNKTLGEIFSDNISYRYTNYCKNHNKIIIDLLLHDKDENIALYFQKLFNITFLQCLEKFSGNDEIKELDGFTKFSEIEEKLPNESGYIEAFRNYLNNYKINLQKKGKKTKIEEEDKLKKLKIIIKK